LPATTREYDRQKISSDIDERTLRENLSFPPLRPPSREAQAGAIMDAYNLVNGVYMTANII